MNKFLTIAIIVVTTMMSANTFAQKQYKFGHIDSNQLLSVMPEREKAKVDLEKYAKQLETTMTSMQSEFQRKYQEYMQTADSLSKFIRQTKEAELSEMQQRIQSFQETAQQDLGERENELLQPIILKARQTIVEVAEEGGYTYVFDLGTGAILHFSSDSEDILPLVKLKLGIK